MAAGNTKFATQGRATQECDLSGVAMRKSREGRGAGNLPSPAFCFFVQRCGLFPGTKRLPAKPFPSPQSDGRLGVPGDFYSLIEKSKSSAPELPAPGYLCFSLSMRKTSELFQLRLC